MIKTILSGHTSEATAFVIPDYPYGRLRCQKRVWLEHKKNKGVRLVSRTSNPKRGNDWRNAAKASTYSDISGALYLDENGHVQWAGVHQSTSTADARKFLDTFGDAALNLDGLKYWVAMKETFKAELQARENPDYGTPLYLEAYRAAKAKVAAASV